MIKIITDSASDFEVHEYEKLDVVCIPLCVSFGNAEYQETINLTKDEFYELLESTNDFPRTAQPSPYTLECILQKEMEADNETIIITLSSGFSGFYQNTVMVKEQLGYNACYVIDSKTGTGGLRILVEQAVKLRDAGKSAREIVSEIEALKSKIALYACMDTLEYLHRGGRISNAAYTFGNLTHIKPILEISKEGLVKIVAKMMGMRKGMSYLIKRLETRESDEKYPLYVMFTGDRTNGEILAGRLNEKGYIVPNERIINVGAAIGSHIGPNACGIVYVEKE